MLRIRSTGWTCEQLGKLLECSADTVENASNERSLLSFDSIARLGYHFPEEFGLIEALWTCRATPEPTPTERLERIERELKALREEVAV